MSTNNKKSARENVVGLNIHERALEILRPILTAQGRPVDAYSSDEYLLAAQKAQSELEPGREVDWVTRRAREHALENGLADIALNNLETEGREFSPDRYIDEINRLMAAIDVRGEKDEEVRSLADRVAALEARERLRRGEDV